MGTSSLKDEMYAFCNTYVGDRLGRLQNQLKDIQLALSSETKSSAGDKHETGRAMIQIEREKLGNQLAEAEKMQELLSKVPITLNTNIIALGSWVKTTKSNYFIAISAGAFSAKGVDTYCISANTPIGKLLLGKNIKGTFSFNGEEITILEIL